MAEWVMPFVIGVLVGTMAMWAATLALTYQRDKDWYDQHDQDRFRQ